MSVSYFEIGGEMIVLELGDVSSGSPEQTIALERSSNKKQIVATRGMGLSPMDHDEDYDLLQGIRGTGRAARAARAFTTAATLAVVDGPLPFGDILAVGLLVAYGMYETHRAIVDIRQ